MHRLKLGIEGAFFFNHIYQISVGLWCNRNGHTTQQKTIWSLFCYQKTLLFFHPLLPFHYVLIRNKHSLRKDQPTNLERDANRAGRLRAPFAAKGRISAGSGFPCAIDLPRPPRNGLRPAGDGVEVAHALLHEAVHEADTGSFA